MFALLVPCACVYACVVGVVGEVMLMIVLPLTLVLFFSQYC